MSNQLIAALMSFQSRIKSDSRSSVMFEGDYDTLSDAINALRQQPAESVEAEVYGALFNLFALKRHKDTIGKDAYYETQQPLAWERAKNALFNNAELTGTSQPMPLDARQALEMAAEIAVTYCQDGKHPDDLEQAIRALIPPARDTRSQLRRIAVQKGEPMPMFEKEKDGMVMVPREPSIHMLQSALEACRKVPLTIDGQPALPLAYEYAAAKFVYKAMIAAHGKGE